MNSKFHAMLRKLRQRFEQLYGPRLVRMLLYGSQARKSAVPGSDTDVLVVLTEPVEPCQEIERTIAIVSDLSLEYDEAISCVFVSDEEFERERSPLLLNVRNEGLPV